MKGVRRGATQSFNTTANISRVVTKKIPVAVNGKGSGNNKGLDDESDEDPKSPIEQNSPKFLPMPSHKAAVQRATASASPKSDTSHQPGNFQGVIELLTQQLQAARQDLAQRAHLTLEQLEHACLDSFQLVEASNAQLRQENDRLYAENERLQAQFGSGGSDMGGTGESPVPPRQHPNREPVTPTGGQAQGKSMFSSAIAVRPPTSLRPKTPNCADGPPTMSIPGVVEEVDETVTQTEVSESDEAEDLKSHNRPTRLTMGLSSDTEDEDSEDDENTKREARRRSLFADADKMKQKVREAVMKKEYDVREAYKDSGVFSWIAKSTLFDHFTLGVILVNAIWISIDLDFNEAQFILEADLIYQVAEFSFCGYFTIEVIIRFIAFRSKFDCLKDAWFVFDSCLVSTMLFDTGVITLVVLANGKGSGAPGGLADPTILRMFRMLKLTRMARMVRLLRAMPELMILIKGIVVAFRSVLFTLALLLIFIYLFAIMFKSLTADSPSLRDDLFPNVRWAMLNLLLQGTLPDHESLVMKLWNESVVYGLLAIFFILMTSLTVMNMLVGVLVEVVGVVSSVEKESMNVQFVYSKLNELLTTGGLDADGDKRISKAEFESLLLNPKAARMVQEVGVDVVGLVDFSEYLFQNDATLSFPEFMDLVLQLRGSNTATVKDVVDLRKFICSQVIEINDLIKQIAGMDLHAGKQAIPSADVDRFRAGKTKMFGRRPPGPEPLDELHPMQWAAPRPPSGPSSPNGNAFSSPLDSMWETNGNKHSNSQWLDEEV